ncbi:MAG: hypothetical protein K8R48_00750 [Alphaproteobacteria bacterium]|nr:hypothetical protein [Alphaproteobacteria bacterium]
MNTTEQSALQTIRERFVFLATGGGAPPATREFVSHAVSGLDSLVDTILARQIWAPGNPGHGNAHGEPLPHSLFTYGTHYFGEVYKVARMWRCPFSRHYQKPEVLERIIAGLRFGEKYVRPDQPRDGSWYYWDIMYAGSLLDHLLVLGDAVPEDLRQLIIEDVQHMPCKTFAMDRENGITRPPITSGSNNLAVLTTGLLRGLVLNDPQWIKTVMSQIPIAMGRATGSEGLQADWSYHFHGHGINVGYGHHALSTQAEWLYLTQGTPWQISDNLRELHVGTIREFFARNVWRGRVAPFSADRGISSPGAIYGREFLGMLMLGLMTDLPPQDKEVFRAAVADYLRSVDQEGRPLSLTEFDWVTGLMLGSVPKPIQGDPKRLGGIRYYPESEYLLARQPDWFAAVRMSSARTSTWKSMLGGHVYSSSIAEFSIALMSDGREYDFTTIPTMNWRRIMGVTRCDAIEPPPEGYGQSTFSSGIAGDELAVMGLQYVLAPAGQDTLRANKSVFVTPQALVMLGTLIRCDAADPVFTTLFFAPVIEGSAYSRNGTTLDIREDGIHEVKAGDTLFLRNVGIHLLTDAQLVVETRRGCHADLNDPQRADPMELQHRKHYRTMFERRFVYLIVNHGVGPRHGRYGAIISPGAVPDFASLQILQEDTHHRVTVQKGAVGGEVRFPGDWRKKIGSSYWGAEQHQWGSIARWLPSDDADHAQLEIRAPRRFARAEQSPTEIFLPEGLEMENVTLKTYAGQPFPANILSTSANGTLLKYRVRKIRHSP